MINCIEIQDLSDPALAMFTRLTEAQLRNRLEPSQGIFIAESEKVIRLALNAGLSPVAFLMERSKLESAQAVLAQCPDCVVYTGERSLLTSLTGYALTRGILCAMHRPALPDAVSVCRDAQRIAVLDGIVDATNIGAIFRSAAALDIDAVVVSTSCCDPLNRRAVRVSMGTIFQIPWTYLPDAGGLSLLHELGFHTAAMALRDDAVSIDTPALAAKEKLAILLGSEGTGLPADTIARCDSVVRIPMSHGVDSLNVAAASALAFWALRKPK